MLEMLVVGRSDVAYAINQHLGAGIAYRTLFSNAKFHPTPYTDELPLMLRTEEIGVINEPITAVVLLAPLSHCCGVLNVDSA